MRSMTNKMKQSNKIQMTSKENIMYTQIKKIKRFLIDHKQAQNIQKLLSAKNKFTIINKN